MATHTLKLSSERIRQKAMRWLAHAPLGMLIKFQEPTRSLEQNAKLWAMLEDVARQARHNGREYSKENWKLLFMSACGHELKMMVGLNGEPVSMGLSSSCLSVSEMSDLIEFIHCWAANNGIQFTERGWDYGNSPEN